VFCRRIEHAEYIGCPRRVVRFEPLRPVTPGHMLFVHQLHTPYASLEPWLTGVVFEVASAYADRQGEDFNLITSEGPAATQTVRHLHVHYVPRRPGDGLLLPWSNQT
jgi:histidine triad (HIT) family protein